MPQTMIKPVLAPSVSTTPKGVWSKAATLADCVCPACGAVGTLRRGKGMYSIAVCKNRACGNIVECPQTPKEEIELLR